MQTSRLRGCRYRCLGMVAAKRQAGWPLAAVVLLRHRHTWCSNARRIGTIFSAILAGEVVAMRRAAHVLCVWEDEGSAAGGGRRAVGGGEGVGGWGMRMG